MKKLIIAAFVAAAMSFPTETNAQDLPIAPAAGVELALPIGDFGDVYNPGFGVFAKGAYGLDEQMAITARLGLNRWTGSQDFFGDDFSYKFRDIQLQGGFRYALQNLDEGLYGEANLGLHFIKFVFEQPNFASLFGGVDNSEPDEVTDTDVGLGFAIGGGYMINNIDIFARLQVISIDGNNANYLALGAGYFF